MITEKTLKILIKKILEIQQNRDPFLMIDYAENRYRKVLKVIKILIIMNF